MSRSPSRFSAAHYVPVVYCTLLIILFSACGAASHTTALSADSAHTPPACTPDPGKVSHNCSGTPVTGKKGLSTCNGPTQPTCPPIPTVHTWVHLNSIARSDVIAALQACPDYISPVDVFQLPANAAISFDTPVLVLSATIGPRNPLQYSDYLVVRVFIDGVRAATYSLHYDRAGQRISISSFGKQQPNDPSYGKPFPFTSITADAAMHMLQSSRGVGPQSGTLPQLVYFELDPRDMPPILAHTWTGGGESEGDPLWRVQGGDGKLYFIGIDSKVYDAGQLPIAPGDSLVML